VKRNYLKSRQTACGKGGSQYGRYFLRIKVSIMLFSSMCPTKFLCRLNYAINILV